MEYNFADVGTLEKVQHSLLSLINEIDAQFYLSESIKSLVEFHSQLSEKILSYTKTEGYKLLKDYFFYCSRPNVFECIDNTILNYIRYLAKKPYDKDLINIYDKRIVHTTVIQTLRNMLTMAENEHNYIKENYLG